jgi:hypothetical protein
MELLYIRELVLWLTQNIGMAKLEKKITKTMLKDKADMEMIDVSISKMM